MFTFGEEYRPCKLSKYVLSWLVNDHIDQNSDFSITRIVLGFPNSSNIWAFQNSLSFKVMEIIQQHASGKPVVIFCNTRKDCVSTAEALAKAFRQFLAPSERGRSSRLPWPRPPHSYATAIDKNLNALLEVGVSYHHAGLDALDRKLIETGFINGLISIVCESICIDDD